MKIESTGRVGSNASFLTIIPGYNALSVFCYYWMLSRRCSRSLSLFVNKSGDLAFLTYPACLMPMGGMVRKTGCRHIAFPLEYGSLHVVLDSAITKIS